MNLSCVICADLFSPSDDVYITPCGHMFHNLCLLQWFERSKTCPQCRNKCLQKQIHKVFFNLANLDTSSIDIGSLQQQLDDCNLKQNITQKEIDKKDQEITKLKSVQKKCMKTISGLENKIQQDTFVISSYNDQFKVFKNDANMIEEQRYEIKKLKQQIELMTTVQSIITSTTSDVEKMLKENNSKECLSTCLLTLKRELRASESKRTDLRNTLKVVQHEARKEHETKKKLEEKIVHLESELYSLSTKYEQLETNKAIQKTENNDFDSPNLNISNAISKRVKLIEESTSPYLNIKSSSVGIAPLIKRVMMIGTQEMVTQNEMQIGNVKHIKNSINGKTFQKSSSDLSDKYSIFKKPRLLLSNQLKNPNLVYNGFGGTEKKSNEQNNFKIKY